MPVPTDPVVLILMALALWGYWAACVYRYAKSSRRASLIPLAGADRRESGHPPAPAADLSGSVTGIPVRSDQEWPSFGSDS